MTRNRRPQQTQSRASHFGKFAILIAFAFILSCVTVNVNFPESAVERAADDFVKDLYAKAGKKTETEAKPAVKKPTKKKAPEPTTFNFELISSAYAAELNTSTATANQIKGEMAGRLVQIDAFKNAGIVCETMNGKLRFKDASKSSNPGVVKEVMDKENGARDRLFNEIKAANPGVQEDVVVKYFSAAFRRANPNGNCD